MKKDYLSTFAVEFANLLAGILVFKLAAQWWGREGFAEYALGRRTLSLLIPLLFIGMEAGLPRYVAMSRPGAEKRNYLLGGLLVGAAATALMSFAMIIFREAFSLVFFGSTDYAGLALPLGIMLWGLILHSVIYSYFRGSLRMPEANLLSFLNIGLLPVLVFFLSGDSVSSVFALLGKLQALVSLVALALVLRKARLDARETLKKARQLTAYGIRRVPGGLMLVAFLTLPATFTAHVSGVAEAGLVAFALSVLSMIGMMFSPIGVILLPRASRMLEEGANRELRRHVSMLLKYALGLTLPIVLVLEVFADVIVRVYLGASFAEAAGIMRIILAGAFPYVAFICGRGLIDAFYFRAVNTLNIVLAFVVFCGLSFAAFSFTGGAGLIPYSFLLGLYILGGLSLVEMRKILAR